ncbi:methyltransferase domain-containing protein [Nocardia panacis]|uniref:Methyltransferase domain-containing protein n=1 Tax=Nocardia panacis TaxID=2340916 RepID=A0A3A4KKU5_9NOCA|nr:methyltransferase domain-containing protein [Nocardia panacis]RJO77294.1 methyltransferase domain-containing protein [Nocardia panacis]
MFANPLARAEIWDQVADGYAEFAPAIMQPFSARALEFAAPTPDSRIVDVAAGTGVLSLLAAPEVAEVQAVDFSAAMVERLDKAASAAGLSNITAQVGDGQALPYADERFDAAFSMFGLMFFPRRAKGFAEMFRVLRPGGVAVVSSWAPVLESPLMRMLFGACHAADPAVHEPNPNYLSLENPEVFESEMRAAGFAAISIQRHSTALTFPDGAAMFDTLVRSSAPMRVLRRDLGERRWAERTEVMRAYLLENYRPHHPLSTTALMGVGHRRE